MLKLKEIHIKNFKSLRDCKLKLGNYNVLVGANATGKTNLVDLFLLLRKIYVEKDINPFRYWWGYQNAVWNRREELDISVRFVFEYIDDGKSYEIHFETTFTGRGGRFEILREALEIKGFLSFELSGGILRVRFDERWRDDILQMFQKLKRSKSKYIGDIFNNIHINLETLEVSRVFSATRKLFDLEINIYITSVGRSYVSFIQVEEYWRINLIAMIPIPLNLADNLKITEKDSVFPKTILNKLPLQIYEYLSSSLVLKLNINEIKRPSALKREYWLSEDGSNLNSVLYNLFLKESRFPDRIATVISYLFPNINLGFSVTEDQRVYIKVQEDSLELPPVCIADGLYKLLAILTALELKPSLLIIDEVENSLHPETLEKLLDELKSSETTVIITTHSPVVVDMTDPADLVIVEKIAGETKFRRIENPEEIKKKLREAGITFSEGWLYGQI
ncbi:AAA family ATPase [Archaeoglobus sp.]